VTNDSVNGNCVPVGLRYALRVRSAYVYKTCRFHSSISAGIITS
jgi:hypothetical protein